MGELIEPFFSYSWECKKLIPHSFVGGGGMVSRTVGGSLPFPQEEKNHPQRICWGVGNTTPRGSHIVILGVPPHIWYFVPECRSWCKRQNCREATYDTKEHSWKIFLLSLPARFFYALYSFFQNPWIGTHWFYHPWKNVNFNKSYLQVQRSYGAVN